MSWSQFHRAEREYYSDHTREQFFTGLHDKFNPDCDCEMCFDQKQDILYDY